MQYFAIYAVFVYVVACCCCFNSPALLYTLYTARPLSAIYKRCCCCCYSALSHSTLLPSGRSCLRFCSTLSISPLARSSSLFSLPHSVYLRNLTQRYSQKKPVVYKYTCGIRIEQRAQCRGREESIGRTLVNTLSTTASRLGLKAASSAPMEAARAPAKPPPVESLLRASLSLSLSVAVRDVRLSPPLFAGYMYMYIHIHTAEAGSSQFSSRADRTTERDSIYLIYSHPPPPRRCRLRRFYAEKCEREGWEMRRYMYISTVRESKRVKPVFSGVFGDF